jgi:uncharacterized protein (TIGR03086 family)
MDMTTLTAACAVTERVVAGIDPSQYSLPTPCSDWDVHDVLNHLLGTLALGRDLLSDSPPGAGASGPGQLPAGDLVGGDPAGAYGKGVAELLAAAGGDALVRTHATPLGDMPGQVLGGFTTLDILVHGWDLARATGQDPELDDEVAGPVLAFAREAFVDEGARAPSIGPEVAVPAGASVTDRLVGFLGRTP